jgi:predicted GNAT family N-acyltransferase
MTLKQNIMDIEERLMILPINEEGYISRFACEYIEYEHFLKEEAQSYEDLNISHTHLLIDTQANAVLAYMSLVADSVRLSKSEKELEQLGLIPFSTFPAMKIGKLAVDNCARTKYYGIGSLMIRLARGFTSNLNDNGIACRFLTIDADIENDPNVVEFYIKNGFIPNESLNNKNRLTISMRKDIFIDETL